MLIANGKAGKPQNKYISICIAIRRKKNKRSETKPNRIIDPIEIMFTAIRVGYGSAQTSTDRYGQAETGRHTHTHTV